jgi:CubicO group peptidase (beta-lactamase class C family)
MNRILIIGCLTVGSVSLLPVPTPSLTDSRKALVTKAGLQKLLEKIRAENDVPALAAGLFRPGVEPVIAVAGVRKRGAETAATTSDQWHLGSNTKPVTALLIALLIEQGLLDWDTPLAEIFPEEADRWNADVKKITPAQLLTHTSGLPDTGPLFVFFLVPSKDSPMQDRARVVHGLEKVKLDAKPGEKYAYANLGYVVLGAILDRRGKAAWEEQVQKRIFEPLSIKSWGLGPFENKEAERQPWPHAPGGKPLALDDIKDNPPVINSAGRLRLCMPDYGRYLLETLRLARGEPGLLKPATAQKLFTNPYPISPHSLAGWGGFRKTAGEKGLILSHNGSNRFNYCTAAVEVDTNRALCVLTNQGEPGGPGEKACYQVRKELGFE